MKYHIGDQFDSPGKIAAQGRGMDNRFLFGRESIEFSAPVFQAAVDLVGFPALRPLEQGVLHEVSHSMFVRPFVAASGVNGQTAPGGRSAGLAMYATNPIGEFEEKIFHSKDSRAGSENIMLNKFRFGVDGKCTVGIEKDDFVDLFFRLFFGRFFVIRRQR